MRTSERPDPRHVLACNKEAGNYEAMTMQFVVFNP